jgi:hypothetical protein
MGGMGNEDEKSRIEMTEKKKKKKKKKRKEKKKQKCRASVVRGAIYTMVYD